MIGLHSPRKQANVKTLFGKVTVLQILLTLMIQRKGSSFWSLLFLVHSIPHFPPAGNIRYRFDRDLSASRPTKTHRMRDFLLFKLCYAALISFRKLRLCMYFLASLLNVPSVSGRLPLRTLVLSFPRRNAGVFTPSPRLLQRNIYSQAS